MSPLNVNPLLHRPSLPVSDRRLFGVVAWLVAGLVGLAVLAASPCRADEPSHVEVLVRPAMVEDGGVFDVDEAGRLLLRQSILERALEEGANAHQLDELIGRSRSRQLDRARFIFDLHASHLGRDPRDDPRFEDARDAVFSAWKKIQRERLEESLGLEAWWDRKRAGMRRGKSKNGVAAARVEPDSSWSLRLSPRLSDDSVGLKVRLRGTGSGLLDHLTFRYTYEVDDSHPVFILRFEDRLRYFDVNFAPDTPDFGDRLGVSLRYSW